MRTLRIAARTVLVLAATAATANAQQITPVGATASSTFETYALINLINNSGLSGGLHDELYSNMWIADRDDIHPTLTFDLGGVYDLTAADIWQYNVPGVFGRGVQNFTIAVSSDDVNFTQVASATLTESSGGNIPAQVVPFSGTGRYVRFSVQSNYGDPQFAGLSEVKFEGTLAVTADPIPALSPAALALFAGVLSLLGLAVLRRSA